MGKNVGYEVGSRFFLRVFVLFMVIVIIVILSPASSLILLQFFADLGKFLPFFRGRGRKICRDKRACRTFFIGSSPPLLYIKDDTGREGLLLSR